MHTGIWLNLNLITVDNERYGKYSPVPLASFFYPFLLVPSSYLQPFQYIRYCWQRILADGTGCNT